MEIKLKDIARLVGGKIKGDPEIIITGVNSLELAKKGEISFFADKRYRDFLKKTEASAIIVKEETELFDGSQIIVKDPVVSFVKVANLFYSPPRRYPGISDKAFIGKNVRIGKEVSIYPFVYIGDNVVIEDRVNIFPGTFIGDNVVIGEGTVIYPNVTILERTIIGKNCIIHSGTVIGSDGFGFVKDGSRNLKVPQMGYVQIDDDVEIGANCCIDRATYGKTWIKSGVKTDNMVHIAHNVTVGKNTIIVAQAGISGSVQIGDEVIIGGQVGIVDHIRIGNRVMIGPQSGVAKSIPDGKVFSGTPAMPHNLFLKSSVLIPKLPEMRERILQLEKRIKKIEERLKKEET